ncbi:hypothetical protein LOTGIDRAFT_203162 [Lottia gigantea]|uniref:Nucleoporin Nup37 n=1 Tax=Lottia gigantea TaxID=225164 RepID=V4BKJ8_LOTGI|nr:hypothetical protein LOTGIDRAFT_203162 [Lottia gigantea]ESO89119.1 hypothetical protein LOTGIDRAFT_203162 [Lottia gigantea]
MTDDSNYRQYNIPRSDVVQCVEFSPFEWSSKLLAVATGSRVAIFSCRFQEEDNEVNGFEYNHIREFKLDCKSSAIAWSPGTSLSTLPKVMCFIAAGVDYKLRLLQSDLKDDDTVLAFEGHSSYVNSVTFEPNQGEQIASTGDDLTCRIWNKDGDMLTLFQLTSPGMSVCWHNEEDMKILVGQKNGVIRIFSLHNQQPIMSLNCGQTPLMSTDWSRHNCLLVGAIAGSDWMMFDTSLSSQPIEKRQAHIDGGKIFRWSRCHESLLATIGRPGRQIKVFNTRHQQLHINTSLPVAYGLTWHLNLPIIAVGGDKRVHIWVVESA